MSDHRESSAFRRGEGCQRIELQKKHSWQMGFDEDYQEYVNRWEWGVIEVESGFLKKSGYGDTRRSSLRQARRWIKSVTTPDYPVERVEC